MSRVARRTFEGLSIERELKHAEVPRFAANEPITRWHPDADSERAALDRRAGHARRRRMHVRRRG